VGAEGMVGMWVYVYVYVCVESVLWG
jgi:hypothetical protein